MDFQKLKSEQLIATSPKLSNGVEKVRSTGVIELKKELILDENVSSLLNTGSFFTYKLISTRKRPKKKILVDRYQQLYKGLPLISKQVSITYKEEEGTKKVQRIAPNIETKDIHIDVIPSVNKEKLYQILAIENAIEVELVIVSHNQEEYKLSWRVQYVSDNRVITSTIDALSGEILSTYERDYNVDRDAPTENHNQQTLDCSLDGNRVELITENGNIRSYDFNQADVGVTANAAPGSYDPLLIPNMPSNQDPWTNMEADESVYQAHWMATNAVAEFLSIDIEYTILHVGANCAPEVDILGNNWPNAFAIGGSTLAESWIIFSDDTPNGSTLAEYDIMGHELAHVYLNDFLAYTQGGNASLHEGIADMLGVYIEGSLDVNGRDWEMGDDVPFIVRDLQNPAFNSFNQVQGFGFGDRHIRSTPLGHWFYLIIEGSSTNAAIVPIDISSTIEIIIESLEILNNVNADYPDFRTATLDHLFDEFGPCSQEYLTFVAAWDEIDVNGVSEECPCDLGPEISIDQDITISTDQFLRGNISVVNGATLTIENATIGIVSDVSLVVQDGSTLILNSATLESCDENELWQGIVLEDGASFSMENSWIVRAEIGIEFHDLASPLVTFHDNLFRDCYYGIRTIWAEDINLNGLPNNPFGQIFGHNLFQTCEYGIETIGGRGSIKYALFDQCDQGINISQSRGKITVQHCEIGFLDRYGLRAFESDVKILDNVIGEPTIIGGGVGKIGIEVSNSSIDIRNNIIEANEKGISTAFVFSDRNAIIDHNTVEINGNNDYGVTGIYNWWTQDVTVRDNRVFGSGQDVGIYALNCFSNKVEENTVEAYGSDNGIAITGGSDNVIERNLVENDPTNGLLNTSSTNNAYHDNDVSASNQGLSIEPLSKTQTITCNRFCSGNFDLNIESNLDRDPDHFWNRFRQDGSRARVIGLSSNEINRSRFFYDREEQSEEIPCAEVELFVEDDPAGLFNPNNDVNYIHCVEDAGSSLKKLTPETLCDEVMALSSKDYWLKLRQLLGRYFDTHGPKRLPDCIPECMIAEVAILEAQLRATMRGSIDESGDSALSQSEIFRQTAAEQYNRLGGGQATIVVYDKEPCGPKDEIYLETYKMVVKEISTNSLDEGDLSGLKAVASLCYHDYGEVVGWARGLLDRYEEPFLESDCARQAIQYRAAKYVQPNLNISPMPASDVLSVQLNGIEDNSEGQLWVMDIAGRILLRRNVSGSNTYDLLVTNLEEGYYIISYNGSTNSRMTKSFIVHR